MERANLFNPFCTLPLEHENRLTWAFLVALKCDPLLQNFLRELVERNSSNQGCLLKSESIRSIWEPARVSTQTKGIDSKTRRLVSVLLTDGGIESTKVGWSDRDAVYDGVIEYPNGLTFIVENKPSHGDVWQEQLSPSRSSYSGNFCDVCLHELAICLEWSEILEGVVKYVDSGTAAFSSREICRDFLSFVKKYHPSLTPYRTLKLCGNRPQALQRWAIWLLKALAAARGLECRDDEYLFRPGKIAERIALSVVVEPELALKVSLWPADTVNQARRFYNEADKTKFLGLDEWEIRPNLHFSYVNTHLIWAESSWENDRYFDYFFGNQQSYGQMNHEKLAPLAEKWENEGLITSVDRTDIEYQFNSTKRETLNVIPGFSVCRVWKLNTATDLEERGQLESHIIGALAAPLDSWGETLSPD